MAAVIYTFDFKAGKLVEGEAVTLSLCKREVESTMI